MFSALGNSAWVTEAESISYLQIEACMDWYHLKLAVNFSLNRSIIYSICGGSWPQVVIIHCEQFPWGSLGLLFIARGPPVY